MIFRDKNLEFLGPLTLVLTGRAHWLTAVFAALLPFVRGLLTLLGHIPLLKRVLAGVDTLKSRSEPGEMSREEALQILGLPSDAGEAEIIETHRRLMQKLHPDRGGSAYLADTINLAKDTLLGK